MGGLRIVEYRLNLGQVIGNPLFVNSSPITDFIVACSVSLAFGLYEAANNIEIGKAFDGVLGGASWHSGVFKKIRHGGNTVVDKVGNIEATIEAGSCFRDRHRGAFQSFIIWSL